MSAPGKTLGPVRMLVSASLMFASIIPGFASHFLGRLPNQAVAHKIEHAILAEAELMLGSGHRSFTERRLGRIEQDLRPMFEALPKNQHGNLDHSAASYALHRLFVQRHAWFLVGLVPEGEANAQWNLTSPTNVLPENIQELFEKRFNASGSGLREVALLVATLEHMVHTEEMARLQLAFQVHGFGEETELSVDEAHEVLDTYMTTYLMGSALDNVSTVSADKVHELRVSIAEVYPNWPATQQFLRDTCRSVAPSRDYLFYADIANVVEEVGERYGRWQDVECRHLKDELVAKEDPSGVGSGRVPLSKFYTLGEADHEIMDEFAESPMYLRQLGALDESDASNPRVIIPNYINSLANCVASSSYYSVCCMNECEGLLGHLERQLGRPDAAPADLAALVADLPSATVPRGRVLSTWLMERLADVAAHHSGTVPLHGRLFAQWLHYAYPRECPYPHVAGTTSPFRFNIEAEGEEEEALFVTAGEALEYIAQAAALPKGPNVEGGTGETTMWTMDEELVVCRAPVPDQPLATQAFGAARLWNLVLVAGMATVSAGVAKHMGPVVSKSRPSSIAFDRHHV